jgi:hypothetical protein
MQSLNRYFWPGVLALMLSGTAVAHGSGPYPAYGHDRPSGNVTIWGDSSGRSGWAGSLSYGIGYGYAPGYVPWGHVHEPRCGHIVPRGYARGYRDGYRNANKHRGYKYRSHEHRRRHH